MTTRFDLSDADSDALVWMTEATLPLEEIALAVTLRLDASLTDGVTWHRVVEGVLHPHQSIRPRQSAHEHLR